MKHSCIYLTLLIIFASFFSSAQAQSIYRIGDLNDLAELYNFSKSMSENDLKMSDIQGCPYESKEFVDGYLVTIDNKKYEHVPLRLNIYNDEIEYKNKKGDVLAVSNKEIVDHLVIGDSKYKYLPFEQGKKMLKSIFKVVEEGEATLLVKQNIVFKEAQPAAAYKDPTPPSFLKKMDEFYIKVGDDLPQKVFKKNDLTEILSDKVAGFIKKNKVKITRLEDLQKVVQYYNSN